jgi:hypothetical protein
LDIDEVAAPGEYDVPVSVRYRLSQDSDQREVLRSLKVAVAEPEPIWVIRSLAERLRPGSSETVSMLLENKGGMATDVTAQFIPQVEALVKPVEGTVYVGDFRANESKGVSFPTLVERGASGNQQVIVRVEYSVDGSRMAESHSITLKVGGLLGSSLILEDVVLTPDPRIGDEFEASLTVENVGTDDAQAALVDLLLPESLGVVGSGSTISIGTVSPGQSVVVTIRLVSDSGASEGTDEVAYLLKWTNSEGEEFGREGSFGVTLGGIPQVVIQRIDIDPPKLESRAKGTFQVTLRNPGTQLVSDIKIKLLGAPELFTETLLPIGSLFPKQTDSVIFGLFVDPELEEGVYDITVSVTYLDAAGMEHNVTSIVDLKIYEKASLFSFVNLLVLLGVVGALVIIYLVFGDHLLGTGPEEVENGAGNGQ